MTIDPEIATFVADSDAFYPPDAATRGIGEQRRLYDAYAEAFTLSRPSGLDIEDGGLAVVDRTIALRRYRPRDGEAIGTILYAHGGGFVLGSLASHDGIVARIAAHTAAEVIAIDYRLAPEHPAPAAREDVSAVIQGWADDRLPWRSRRDGRLALTGDSAGAMLVASAALVSTTPLCGLALVYPMLGRDPAPPARDAEAHAPMLSLADVYAYRDLYLGGREPDSQTFPLDAPRLAGLPPVFLLAAEHDPLRDDCTAFATRLRSEGVDAECIVARGLVHGFLRALDRSAVAARAFNALVQFLTRSLQRRGD